MKSKLTTLKVFGEYVFPGVAKDIEVFARSNNIEEIKQAMNKNTLVFLLTYELEDGYEEKYNNLGTIVRVLNIKEKANTYVITVLGINRALIHKFDSKNENVINWVRKDYEREAMITLREAYLSLVKSVKEYALFMNSLSAYRIYSRYYKKQINKIDISLRMNQALNKLIVATLNETEAQTMEFQDYLETNQLSQTVKNLQKRLYALMVKEYNERYHFPEYETVIPEIDLHVKDNNEDDQQANKMIQAKETIQEKINEEQDELEKLKLEIIEKGMPQEKLQIIQQEIALLSREHEESKSRINGVRYLQTVANLPWSFVKQERNIKEAKEIMDTTHYGMNEAKNEIIKFLAERALNKDAKGTVLCLSGPPGVGKTSLVKTVANATNQEFIQIKLGGISDESIIRGFSRTFTGSEPGIFVKEMAKINSLNPVILLDEIDKINVNSTRGDVSAALLEVLDPSQNNEFRDNYLGITYDLSKPLYIATANYLDRIPPALKDRMEIIHLQGYTATEKLTIVQEYILGPILKDGWLKEYDIKIDEAAIERLIEVFSKEPGIRSLERSVLGMCREIALRIMLEDKTTFHLTVDNILEFTNNVHEQDLETVQQSIGFLRDF